jgi:hypothetical protein
MTMGLLMTACGLSAVALTGCTDPTENARPVTIRNDTKQAVVLQLCDLFGCDHLNDRIDAGAATTENVSTDIDPYEFRVVDAASNLLGCLEIETNPLTTNPITVSSMRACRPS